MAISADRASALRRFFQLEWWESPLRGKSTALEKVYPVRPQRLLAVSLPCLFIYLFIVCLSRGGDGGAAASPR